MLGAIAILCLVASGFFWAFGSRDRARSSFATGLVAALLVPVVLGLGVALAGPLLRVLAPVLGVAAVVVVAVAVFRGWWSYRTHRHEWEGEHEPTSAKRRREPWQ